MKGMNIFKSYHGLLANDNDGTLIYGFDSREPHSELPSIVYGQGGCFGYVAEGQIHVRCENDVTMVLNTGHWFSTIGSFTVESISDNYRFAVWQKEDYKGTATVGWVDAVGQLNYIDGCKDSVLHAPIKKGDPCLNALYMPEGVNQTIHTHPSTRSGFIIIGGANCETPDGTIPLETGDIFYLATDTEHKFSTNHQEMVTMKLIAFHPDSDFGPTDEIHPMINRTIVEGVSASEISEIQTGNLMVAKEIGNSGVGC